MVGCKQNLFFGGLGVFSFVPVRSKAGESQIAGQAKTSQKKVILNY
jgi:hypothetical protein